MPEKVIYRCAECGAAITDKQYLRSVKEHELKFCSKLCDMAAWKRGIYEYAKTYNKGRVRKPKPAPPPKKPKGREPLTEKERNEILELAKKRYSKQQIAIAMHRSYSTVLRVIQNYELVYEESEE